MFAPLKAAAGDTLPPRWPASSCASPPTAAATSRSLVPEILRGATSIQCGL